MGILPVGHLETWHLRCAFLWQYGDDPGFLYHQVLSVVELPESIRPALVLLQPRRQLRREREGSCTSLEI